MLCYAFMKSFRVDNDDDDDDGNGDGHKHTQAPIERLPVGKFLLFADITNTHKLSRTHNNMM